LPHLPRFFPLPDIMCARAHVGSNRKKRGKCGKCGKRPRTGVMTRHDR
jgi:hypothetical protein